MNTPTSSADHDSDKKPIQVKVLELVRRLGILSKRFHQYHWVWEIVLALLLAIYGAYYFAGIDRPIYTVYILLGDDIPNTSGEQIRNEIKEPLRLLSLHGTEVKTEILDVPSKTPSTAIAHAQKILNKGDGILVVGILDSEPTRRSLPLYLKARPQVPFIAAVQSVNDLIDSKSCENGEKSCFDAGQPLPILQLSPTNSDEAKWTVKFATDRNLTKFLIVTDDDSTNKDYVRDLANAYEKEIPNTYEHFAIPVNSVAPALLRRPDCILYAGDPGNAKALLESVAHELSRTRQNASAKQSPASGWTPLVILSDTAVPASLASVPYNAAVNLADQSDASYYTDSKQPNAYAVDSVTIAATIVKELEERGYDVESRLRSIFLNRMTAEDIRRNLIRVMQQDFSFHSAYRGADDTGPVPGLRTAYAFDCPPVGEDGRVLHETGSADYCQRYGGIFHVWQWEPKYHAMTDIDPWHPRRGTLSARSRDRETSSNSLTTTGSSEATHR